MKNKPCNGIIAILVYWTTQLEQGTELSCNFIALSLVLDW